MMTNALLPKALLDLGLFIYRGAPTLIGSRHRHELPLQICNGGMVSSVGLLTSRQEVEQLVTQATPFTLSLATGRYA